MNAVTRVGGDDEIGVRSKVHASRPALRLHQPHRAHAPAQDFVAHGGEMQRDESSVKASAMISSGCRIDGSMVGPPMRSTEAGWCSVFHQSTENLMIGN